MSCFHRETEPQPMLQSLISMNKPLTANSNILSIEAQNPILRNIPGFPRAPSFALRGLLLLE